MGMGTTNSMGTKSVANSGGVKIGNAPGDSRSGSTARAPAMSVKPAASGGSVTKPS